MNCELKPGFASTTNLVLENQLSAYATTSALETVSANVSALTSSFATLGSSVETLGSSVSALASSIDEKRDYEDLSYGGTYNPSDAEGYYGITSWHIEGYKYNGQTLPAFNTTTRFKNNQTYGTGWNDGLKVIHTSPSNPSDFSTLYLDGFGNEQSVSFTLSLDKTTYEVSYEATDTGYAEHQDIILTANLANADRLALNSQLAPITASVSAIGSSVSAMASSLSAKRDYTDLTYSYSSTTTLSYYDLYYGEPWHMNYNDGVDDTTQQWGIQEIHVSIPSQLARDYEEWFNDMGLSLPDGYSSFPTEWTLTYVDALEIGASIDFNDTGLSPVENP